MSVANPDINRSAAFGRSAQRVVLLLLLGWTVLAALAVWWLVNDAASPVNTVIRVGQNETKAWGDRLHESIALARLNFPWAIAWMILTPYVLWVGVRFSFEGHRWRSRLLVLLATGIGFIWISQRLSQRLGAGEATILMVKYSADTSVEKLGPHGGAPDDSATPRIATNRLVTNRFTKIMVSGEAARASNHAIWEESTTEILSGLATNLPHLLAGAGGGYLPPPGPIRPRRWSAALDGLAYVALIGLAHAGVFYRRYREREQQAALLEARLNEARLRALQAQLQPHFLFNTLNGIATLLRRDPAIAEEMLLSLSELLRISLSSSHRQEIPLREEMDFLGRYLAIQRMRFGDRLQATEEIDPAALDCLVPALLLQPLVENAIRHGLEPSGDPGTLRIAAKRDAEWLCLAVEDNGVGFRGGDALVANQQPSGEIPRAADATRRRVHPLVDGVGLSNVRERLATLHGDAHEFSITERPEGGVVVNIRLPAKKAVEAAPLLKGVSA